MWKSTSELVYLRIIAETFVSLHAIEQTQLRKHIASMVGAPKI